MLDSAKDALARHWRRWSRQAVSWLEDDGLDEADVADSMVRDAEFNPYQAFESISELLPHAGFMEDEKLFMLESPRQLASKFNPRRVEALAFALELTPLAGGGENLRRSIKNVLIQCPPGSGVQFIAFGDPRIGPVLEQFKAQTTVEDYMETAERRARYWAKASTKGIFPGQPYRLRSQRLLLCVCIPVDDFQARQELDVVINTRVAVQGILDKEQMQPRQWTPEDFLEWMDYMGGPHQVNPEQGASRHYAYNSADLLRHQIFSRETVMRIRPQHLAFGTNEEEIRVRALSTREYPKSTYLWNTADLLGDQLNASNQYPCPYMITLGVMIQDFDARRQAAKVKSARATTNAESYMAKFLPEMGQKKQDWDNMMESFQRGEGDALVFHQVLLFSPPDELEAAQRSANLVWRSRKFKVETDRYMQWQSYQSCIPMALTPSLQHDVESMQRFHTKTVANAADTAPVMGDWRGFGAPKLQLWSRNGSPMNVDFFSNLGGNYNVACAAGSGAGKSVLGNELIKSILAAGGRAFVIDAGHSYEKPCKQRNGQFIEFTAGYTPSFNPFPMIEDLSDEEAFEDVVRMITGMVNSMTAPERHLDDYEKGIVEQVVQEEVAEHGKLGSITGIYQRLIAFKNNQTGEPDPVAGRLAQAMRSYTTEGVFGRYFTGNNPVRFSSDFVVLELDGLNDAPRLQSTVLMIMMFQITQAMYQDRSREKIVLIDEAWSLMRDGATGYFIEAMYRRCRKYRGQAVTITQSFADYFRNATTMAAYSNSDFLAALRQTPEAYEAAFKSEQFIASEAQKHMLRSLETVAGRYSDIMIKGPMGWGVGRLILDPYSLLQYSTKAEDFEAIKRYRDQGMSIDQAIVSVMNERGLE
jgi:conjugal transfer ATP-binding protein TraC